MNEVPNIRKKTEKFSTDPFYAPEIFQEIKELWAQHKKEGDPDLEFKIFFGSHINDLDFAPITEELGGADVYIPEAAGWSQRQEEKIMLLSGGVIHPETLINEIKHYDPDFAKSTSYTFFLAQMKAIYRSGKPIIFIDVPRDHPIENALRKTPGTFFRAMDSTKDLATKIEAYKNFAKGYVELVKARDNFMIAMLPQRLRELLDRRPDLKKKSRLKVLISLGAMHSQIYPKLKDLGQDTAREFQTYPFVFGLSDEVPRRLQMGQDMDSISPDLILKAVLESEMLRYFEKSLKWMSQEKSSQEVYVKMRKIIEKLNARDIEEIYNKFGKGQKFRDVVLDICKQKGIDTRGF
ncbi:MAG: hypothetical protein A3D92_16520 [Bacteroidetes bacterium RIFCSPHIGHO2_02_FULL_44_7]|nr:MAG: hypothetical protein A3D92_16520 [Bacteroidetes bacterium RIFCSPHIGHO2_02_FULL_44_7]